MVPAQLRAGAVRPALRTVGPALLALALVGVVTIPSQPAASSGGAAPIREDIAPSVLVVRHAQETPKGWATSLIFEAAYGWARQTTALDLRSPEQAGFEAATVDGCPGAQLLTCLTRAAPAAERLLFLLVIRSGYGAADELTLLALDLTAARVTLASLAGDAAEDALYRSSLRVQGRAKTGDLSAALQLLEGTADWLEARGHFAPYGEVAIGGRSEGATVSVRALDAAAGAAPGLDAVPLPATLALRPGVRALTVNARGQPAEVHTLEVQRGQRAVLAPQEPDASPVAWLPWATGAMTAAGAGLMLGGALASAEQPVALCLRRAAAECPFPADDPPVLLALGSALAVGGASSLIGHAIAGDASEPHLLVLGIAAFLGGSVALAVGL